MTQEETLNLQVERLNNTAQDCNEYDGYDCPKCKNKTVVYSIKGGAIVQKDCDCKKIRSVLRNSKNSGLGQLLSRCSFENYTDSEEWQKYIKRQAEKFCSDDSAAWFYIGGQSGCGKTHLCTAIINHYIQQQRQTLYFQWGTQMREFKNVINSPVYTTLFRKYADADVLYIDDFLKVPRGVENNKVSAPTDADIKFAFDLINERIPQTDKITVISSEFSDTDLLAYDEATIGRIKEAAGEYCISVRRAPERNYRFRKHTTV